MLGIIVIRIIKIEERLYISTSFISLLIQFNHIGYSIFLILQKCLFYLVWHNIILWLYSECSGHIMVIFFHKISLSALIPCSGAIISSVFHKLPFLHPPLVECSLTRSLLVNRIPSWFYLFEVQLLLSDSHHSCKYLYQNLSF